MPAAGWADAQTTVGRTKVRTTGQSYDATIESVVADLDRFWRRELNSRYGKRYRPVRLATGLTRQSDSFVCGGERISYRIVRGNAFYTSLCDVIAWDDEQLFPSLSAEYGDVVVALVLAHEWGHAAQTRVGIRRATIVMEQQADCFAGAWARDAVDGRGSFAITEEQLDTALAGMLSFRDPVGTSPLEMGSHGSAFDRVNAFQEGYDRGTQRCATYAKTPPDVVQRPFTDRVDAASGGNLPLTQLLDAVTPELNKYWAAKVPGTPQFSVSLIARGADPGSCDAAPVTLGPERRWAECPADARVLVDSRFADALNSQIGDFATATVLARSWAVMALRRSGQPASNALELQADCLAGAWTGEIDRDPAAPSLSPGDLDEAVSTMLFVDVPGDPRGFVRVSRFRTGYFSGFDAC
jgi:predicted metalloprotease